MRRRARLVSLLWRWHRRVGLAAVALVFLLALSGLALNHSASLGLDRGLVGWTWLQDAYGGAPAASAGFPLGEQWLSRSGSGHVYLDAVEVAPCRGELVGALSLDGLLFAGCAEELLLITPEGELVEVVNAGTGLPVPLTGLGLAGDSPAVEYAGAWYLADLERMEFGTRVPAGAAVRQHTAGDLPSAIAARIPREVDWLTWERVLLDLHSGRLAGPGGVLLVDLAAILLCILAASGFAMWWLHRRRGQGGE